MSATATLIHIIGGVCLLLWGVKLVSRGLNRSFGADLRRFIMRSTKNRFLGLFSGAIMAMALQSSTAVTLIAVSFASKGLLTTLSGIALVLGADIGTTLAAQILIFDLSWLVPVLLIIGYVLTTTKRQDGKYHYLGNAFLGVGLILLSLDIVVQVSEPLRESEILGVLIQPLAQEPILAILFAGLLTYIVHSSLAMVLLYASFATTGAIPIGLAMVLVLGANLGSAFIAYADTMREKPKGRRIPLANVIMRFLGIVLILPFINILLPYLSEFSSDPARIVVNFHTVFNVALAILFLPLIGMVNRMAERILPDSAGQEDRDQPRYLDYSALDTPQAALASAERETLRISDTVSRMLNDTLEVLRNDDPNLMRKIAKQDNRVDRLYDAVKKYLARITNESLSENESQRLQQILGFATNLEHIGDILDKSLLELCDKKIRKQLSFSNEGFHEISEAYHVVIENLTLAQHVFMTNDIKMARQLFHGKMKLQDLEVQTSQKHMRRLREGVSETVSTSSMHLDIFRDLRRIQSYLTMVSYPALDEAGELHRSRLKET
tara:strand:- start:3464 stop:5116 length:1653 start_codon:yes stop_codon:yes gene_type:complete